MVVNSKLRKTAHSIKRQNNHYNSTMPTVLITGSRDWTNREIIRSWIEKLKDWGYDTLIEGECRGADIIAREEAQAAGFKILTREGEKIGYPAQWDRYRLGAGPIRNTEMIYAGNPTLVVGFHENIENSTGTLNMLKQADACKIEIYLVDGQGVAKHLNGQNL